MSQLAEVGDTFSWTTPITVIGIDDSKDLLQVRVRHDNNGVSDRKTLWELGFVSRPDGSWLNAWLEEKPAGTPPTP